MKVKWEKWGVWQQLYIGHLQVASVSAAWVTAPDFTGERKVADIEENKRFALILVRDALRQSVAEANRMVKAMGAEPTANGDRRPDNTGLDDGPYLPGHAPRKKPTPKSPEELKEIRAKAWATRRAKEVAP